MHTFEWDNDGDKNRELNDVNCPVGDKVYIHHNGDYSGDATINMPFAMWRQITNTIVETNTGNGSRVEFKLPAEMMSRLSNNHVIGEAIAALENLYK
jgi:hypothetical protein